jgi:hypothetical protein
MSTARAVRTDFESVLAVLFGLIYDACKWLNLLAPNANDGLAFAFARSGAVDTMM